MFNTILITALAMTSGATQSVQQPKIISASLFKNGFSVVLRELNLPSSGVISFTDIPDARLGTFWISASSGVTISEAIRSIQKKSTSVPAGSVEQLIRLNTGKMVQVFFNDDKISPVSGKLIAATGSLILLEVDGNTVGFDRALIKLVQSTGGPLVTVTTSTTEQPVINIKANGAGKVFLLAIEPGMSWTPSYVIDLKSESKLNLVGKGTVLNNLGDLENVPIKLVTGFPMLPYLYAPDPFTADMAFKQERGGAGLSGGAAPAPMQNALRREAMDSGPAGGFDQPEGSGDQIGDLFFYTLSNIRLAKGERGLYTFLNTDTDYEDLFTLNVGSSFSGGGTESTVQDVWRSIVFKNNTNMPWTTAPVMVVSKGEVLGQNELKYTSPGAPADVELTKALDIRADSLEEELSRQRGAIKDADGRMRFDEVSIKGTINILNRKTSSVKMKITKTLTGEVKSTSGSPRVTRTLGNLNAVNSDSTIVWEQTVEPGKPTQLTYTYTVLVPSGR